MNSIDATKKEYFNPIIREQITPIKRIDKNQGICVIDRHESFENKSFFPRDNYILNNYYLAQKNSEYLKLDDHDLKHKIYVGEVLEVIRQEYTEFNHESKGIRKYKEDVREFKIEYKAMELSTKDVSLYRKYYKLYKIVGPDYFQYINENIKERAICLFTKDGINESFIREVFIGYIKGEIKSLSKVEELIYTSPDSFYNKKEQLDSLLTMIKKGFTKRSYENQEDLIEEIYQILKGKKKSKKCKL
ncbi:hypothetical protein NRK67_01675 [Fusobacteria bacterium ZRK30]|nr:hypothetical protein NRK67_01675 [Fusobacteria bacterium ZRK30]